MTSAVVAQDAPKTDAPHGDPPPDRWPDILENARKKEREAVEGQYAWAKGIDRSELDATRAWMDLANRDPILALDRLVQGLSNNPQYQPQLKSYFGRNLASRVNGDQMPEPDIPTDASNGQPVVYSAQQMQKLLDWKDRQFQKKLDQTLGPMQQDRDLAAAKAQADDYAQRNVGALIDQPGFKENAADIAAAYAAIPLEDPRTEGEKFRDAYLSVVGSKFEQKARQQVVTDLQRKGNATTVNPASASAAQPFDWKTASWEEGLRYEYERRKAASR